MNKRHKNVSFRLLWFSLVILALTIVIILAKNRVSSLLLHFNHNEVIYETVSPDGKNKAVMFNRDLGATTWFNYQLSILKRNETLKNKPGNVLITYSQINVEWKNDKTLLVRFLEKKRVFKQLYEFRGISILYIE